MGQSAAAPSHLAMGDIPHVGDGHPEEDCLVVLTPHYLWHHRLAAGQTCHYGQTGHVRGEGAGRGQLDRDGWGGWCNFCSSRRWLVDRDRTNLVLQVLVKPNFSSSLKLIHVENFLRQPIGNIPLSHFTHDILCTILRFSHILTNVKGGLY